MGMVNGDFSDVEDFEITGDHVALERALSAHALSLRDLTALRLSRATLSNEDREVLVVHGIWPEDDSLEASIAKAGDSRLVEKALTTIANLFGVKAEELESADELAQRAGLVGDRYLDAPEATSTRGRAPVAVSHDAVDRGLSAHGAVQNMLARVVADAGLMPLRPTSTHPQFDVAWWNGDVLYVAEVKSITADNEEHQLRLGLGQVLRYRHVLEERGLPVAAVLAMEKPPSDHSWVSLCVRNDVRLVWPGNWTGLALTGLD